MNEHVCVCVCLYGCTMLMLQLNYMISLTLRIFFFIYKQNNVRCVKVKRVCKIKTLSGELWLLLVSGEAY